MPTSTVKHLAYAGVTIPLCNPQLEDRLGYIHPYPDFNDKDFWNYAGFGLEQLPTPSLPRFPKLRVGTLWWPTGASRPAFFYCVVNTTRLDQIRAVVGDPMVPQDLVMFDGRAGHEVVASMYLLPPRPLNQLGHDASDGWLLTLTDRRFYDAVFKRGTITQPMSWTHLYSQISSILGTTITPDTVSAAYLSPSSKWVQHYQPTNTILDSVANQVGQVVVYGLDGSVQTVDFQTAKAASDAQLVGAVAQDGGFVADSDIARYVPESVNVCFGRQDDPDIPFVVNVTLASLAIPEYGTSTGLTGTTGTTFGDTLYLGYNLTEINDYAQQAALDWYGWRLADVDVSIIGILPFVPTGWEDVIEWRIQLRDGGENGVPYSDTRIRRGPWDVFPSGSWLAGEGQGSGDQPDVLVPVVIFSCPIIEHVCVLDCDSNPITINNVIGHRNFRRLIRVTAQSPGTCLDTGSGDCCPGSGSGSEAICDPRDCPITCLECESGTSSTWTAVPEGADSGIGLCHSLSLGFSCLWVSAPGARFTLLFDPVNLVWVLEDTSTGDIWVTAQDDWSCTPTPFPTAHNTMIADPGNEDTRDRHMFPDRDCSGPYSCTDGACIQDPGGVYPTLQACIDAGCGSTTGECCAEGTTMSFTIAGVTTSSTDPLCNCSVINTSWTLPSTAPNEWGQTVAIAPNCFGNTTRFAQMTCDPTTVKLMIYFAADQIVEYHAPTSGWVCPGDNVMTFFNNPCTNCCADWPATVTVTVS